MLYLKKKIKMKKTFNYTIGLILILLMTSSCIKNNKTKPGIFDQTGDIGNPHIGGFAMYDKPADEYTLQGAGKNIWGNTDEFRYVWKEIEGDFIMRCRMSFVGEGTNPHRKAGIMLRKSLEGNSQHASAVVHGDGLTSLQYRQEIGSETLEQKIALSGANIIEIERTGNTVIMRAAIDGETYQTTETNMSLPLKIYAGLFICSHENDVSEKAVFDNVRLVYPAPDSLVPYRDYIGSHIEIMNIENGKRRIVHSSPLSLQAPNWSPNGQKLYYNSEGKIFTFDIENKSIDEIHTGFAVNNNNDHVLSFDGKILGISDHTQHKQNQSLVYTLDAQGGTPELITTEAPSYLHGFSPNSEYLIYTAGRNKQSDLDIYRISRTTKLEEQLTNAEGLDDGSEYSPNGEYIYFNSNRTGTMQIWRMKADGSQQEQLTFDEYNDWFPHVSPNGKWIVFISYSKQINSADHPFYKHVYIRLMPAMGGEPKVIAYLYGGQGSMNVFNWSPDSREIAFVSNTILY